MPEARPTPTSGSHNVMLMTACEAAWSVCSCGWESLVYKSRMAAQLAFGEHLVETNAHA